MAPGIEVLVLQRIHMDSVKNSVRKVKGTISRYQMLDSGDLCIVGVSGGPDSVCLLHILHELREALEIGLVVAHYDHGLREKEDEAETQFVRRLASAMGLSFETEKASLLPLEGTSSMEERARNARYAFFEKLKRKLSAKKIALGHNLNDQAETVLMRLLRGSGPSGLAGIPPTRDNTIIRPLIEMKRDEIESYLKARDLSYVIDSSNLQTDYLRNKIRLELLPQLLEYQPKLIEHLGQLAHILRGENKFLEDHAERWVAREADQKRDGDIVIPVGSFIELSEPVRNRVTRHLLKRIGKNLRRIDRGHIESVTMLAKGTNPQGILNLPNVITVKKIYDQLAFTAGDKEKPEEFHYHLDGVGTYFLEEIGRSITLEEMELVPDLHVDSDPKNAYLDADDLEYPLIVRNFRPGDRFVPFGMAGHKKIKDFFIDLKIPSEMRATIPILVSHDTPVWICGLRIDDRFKLTSETKRVLKATIS
jgi:tRNA(Ile)-lysidine synthase